jgi:hypothetical protein
MGMARKYLDDEECEMNELTPVPLPLDRAALPDVESRRAVLRSLVADLVFGSADDSATA